MTAYPRARRAALLVCCALSTPIHAEPAKPGGPEIVVTARRAVEAAPASAASIDAARIAATVNAVNVEDTLKYLPSLVVRKRHIGDTQSPLATRTSGVGASARSLIYADGALMSALIGNNNTTASPRWGLVSPQEIARIDVLYGPFSAAYPGNSIGAVVNITTRLPEQLEATAQVGTNIQHFRQYGTKEALPAYESGFTIGDRFGPLALFGSANHVVSNSQPLVYATATRGAAGASGLPVNGAFSDVNRTGVPIFVLGAAGLEHQLQDNLKLKAALDLSPDVRLTYVGGLFLNDTRSDAETYLRDTAGQPVYAGALSIQGVPAVVAASAFSNNVYRSDERHWSHSLSATGTGSRVDWQIIGTLYDFARDSQRIPAGALPTALAGGPGNIVRLNGTGWTTLDAKAAWRATGTHTLSGGLHRDRFELASNRYATADWLHGAPGTLNLASRGTTRTEAVWLQEAWTLSPALTLTAGGREEWWKAFDGFNFSSAPALSVSQPSLSATRFSPKASLGWASSDWRVTASFGQAWRFPTVSELYQAVATGPTITVPNPSLRPERARSEELAIQRGGDPSYVRLSLFNERIRDALLSQSGPLVPGSATLFSFVQNVDIVRTRGVELAFQQQDWPLPGIDLSGSATLVDPEILADAAFPAAIGKRPPQVPRRKATLVATYRPSPALSLTAAARHSSRSFGTIDNSDPVSNTYQGFAKYTVVDVRAVYRFAPNWSLALGIDNVTNDRYFLFHPFPQRSFAAELAWKL